MPFDQPASFEETLKRSGMSVEALKAMARGRWMEGDDRSAFPSCWYRPLEDPEEAAMALRFTLSQPVTANVPPGDVGLFRLSMDIASDFRRITPEEVAALEKLALDQEPLFSRD